MKKTLLIVIVSLLFFSVVVAQGDGGSDVSYNLSALFDISKYTSFVKGLFVGDVKSNVDERVVDDFCLRDSKWCLGDSFIGEWWYFSIVGFFTGLWILVITLVGWFTTGGHVLKHRKNLTVKKRVFQWFWANGTNSAFGFGHNVAHRHFSLSTFAKVFSLVAFIIFCIPFAILFFSSPVLFQAIAFVIVVVGLIIGFHYADRYSGLSRSVWFVRGFLFVFAFAISFGLLIAIPFLGHILSAVTFLWAFPDDLIGIIFKSFGVLVPLVVIQLILFRKVTSDEEEMRNTSFDSPKFVRSVDDEVQKNLSPQGVSPEGISTEVRLPKKIRPRRGAPPNIGLPGKRGRGRDF